MTKKEEIVSGVKGFNEDMTCRGFKYEIGKSYKTEKAKVCEYGFHFCENPIDVFRYYNPGQSVFSEVEGSGKISRHDDDSKVASTEIKIKASISLHKLIDASIDFFFKRKYLSDGSNHATGDRSASSATGYSSASSATGDSSASSATGYSSASSATGDASAAICVGVGSKAMAGKYGCICLSFYNEIEGRYEMRCAETGCGDGSDGKLKAEVWYSLNDDGKFIEL